MFNTRRGAREHFPRDRVRETKLSGKELLSHRPKAGGGDMTIIPGGGNYRDACVPIPCTGRTDSPTIKLRTLSPGFLMLLFLKPSHAIDPNPITPTRQV